MRTFPKIIIGNLLLIVALSNCATVPTQSSLTVTAHWFTESKSDRYVCGYPTEANKGARELLCIPLEELELTCDCTPPVERKPQHFDSGYSAPNRQEMRGGR